MTNNILPTLSTPNSASDIYGKIMQAPAVLMGIILVWIAAIVLGVYFIRRGAHEKKTWKIILGVILTGLVGMIYYINLCEKIKSKESKKQMDEIFKKLEELKSKKEDK